MSVLLWMMLRRCDIQIDLNGKRTQKWERHTHTHTEGDFSVEAVVEGMGVVGAGAGSYSQEGQFFT